MGQDDTVSGKKREGLGIWLREKPLLFKPKDWRFVSSSPVKAMHSGQAQRESLSQKIRWDLAKAVAQWYSICLAHIWLCYYINVPEDVSSESVTLGVTTTAAAAAGRKPEE